jgi:hypothetical protein
MARFLFVNRVYPPVAGATGRLTVVAEYQVTVTTMGGGMASGLNSVDVDMR